MDADITAAADALALERIRTQDARDHWKRYDTTDSAKADRLAAYLATMNQAAADLLPPRVEVRLAIVKAIAANYMKPTTGTLPETIAADTANDAARLRAAVNAVEDIVMQG
jgi:hypothetical protein